MELELDRLRHLAQLAELSLTPDEERRLASEIGRIVTYVAELAAIDTTGVTPTAYLAGGGAGPARSEDGWRADEVRPGLSREEALAGAPQTEHGGFAVPTFVE